MDRKLKIVIYVSSWIAAWFILSLVINAGLLQVNLYEANSKFERFVFLSIALISIAGSLSFASEFFGISRDQAKSVNED